MKSAEIREKFLRYFESKGHTIVASSPLVPANDPTLLFTNSGMVQFKDVFIGREHRPYRRATVVAAQRARRRQAQRPRERRLHRAPPHVLRDARQLLVRRLLQARRDRLRVGTADHASTRCRPSGSGSPSTRRTTRRTTSGPTRSGCRASASCGSATTRARATRRTTSGRWPTPARADRAREIFYDHGPDVAGGPPGSPDADGDRYIEIWNLVFMQFDRDDAGMLTPLPKPCVDTGMGLERIAAVLQHVHSNYEIDLFQDLIRAAARETGATDLANAVAARDRRPHPRLRVPDRRRRDPRQRGPRLRAAADHPARAAPRPQARAEAAVLPSTGRGPGARRWATRIPSWCGHGARRGGAAAGGGALRRDARARHGDPRGGARGAAPRCSTARPRSGSTTPSASRST